MSYDGDDSIDWTENLIRDTARILTSFGRDIADDAKRSHAYARKRRRERKLSGQPTVGQRVRGAAERVSERFAPARYDPERAMQAERAAWRERERGELGRELAGHQCRKKTPTDELVKQSQRRRAEMLVRVQAAARERAAKTPTGGGKVKAEPELVPSGGGRKRSRNRQRVRGD